MPCFYLTPKQDDFDKLPELQVCLAEALYDAEAVLSNPSAFKAEEIRTLRDQINSILERAWEITGRSEDELTDTMVQTSQVVAAMGPFNYLGFLIAARKTDSCCMQFLRTMYGVASLLRISLRITDRAVLVPGREVDRP